MAEVQSTIKLLAVQAEGPGAEMVLRETKALGVAGQSFWQKYQVLIACGISSVIVLVPLLFSGILNFEGRIVRVEEQIARIEDRIVGVEGDLDRLRDDMDRLRDKMDTVDEKLNRVLLQLADLEGFGDPEVLAD